MPMCGWRVCRTIGCGPGRHFKSDHCEHERMDLPDLDPAWWGSVPAWLGAGSLILAYTVFRRDRVNAERRQVDPPALGQPRSTSDAFLEPHEWRSAKSSGTFAMQASCPFALGRLRTGLRPPGWWRTKSSRCPKVVHGCPNRARGRIARSRKTWTRCPPERRTTSRSPSTWHIWPHRSRSSWRTRADGVTPRVDWLLVVDNAGRKWEVRPETGRSAKRVHQHWRPSDAYMPRQW